jgi:tetratricopeptide (TPR) repeat protein
MYKNLCFVILFFVCSFASCNYPFKSTETFNTEDFLSDSLITHINSPDTCDGLAIIENEKKSAYLFRKGICYLDNLKGRKAIDTIDAASQYGEISEDSIRYHIGVGFYQIGLTVVAAKYIKDAIKVNNKERRYHRILAFVYQDMNMEDSALFYFNNALQLGDTSVIRYIEEKK